MLTSLLIKALIILWKFKIGKLSFNVMLKSKGLFFKYDCQISIIAYSIAITFICLKFLWFPFKSYFNFFWKSTPTNCMPLVYFVTKMY